MAAGVRVILTSRLEELKDLNIVEDSVNKNQTWGELLQSLWIDSGLDYSQYMVQSTRHTSNMEDCIGDIASWYKVNTIRARVVVFRVPRADTSRNRRMSKGPNHKKSHRGSARAHSFSSAGCSSSNVRETTTSTPNVPLQAMAGPHDPPSYVVKGSRAKSEIIYNSGRSTMADADADTQWQIFPDEGAQLEGAAQQYGGYAESVISQDNVPDDVFYSPGKKSFIDTVSKLRNTDFDEWLKEMKAYQKLNSEVKFRFQRKLPTVMAVLENWTNDNKQ